MALTTEHTISNLQGTDARLILTLSPSSAIKLLNNLPTIAYNAEADDYEKARVAAQPYVKSYFPKLIQHPSPEVKLAAIRKAMEYVNISSFHPSHGTIHNNYPGTAVTSYCMQAISDKDQDVAEAAISLIGTFLDTKSYHPQLLKKGGVSYFFEEIQSQVFEAIDNIKKSDSPELKRALVKQTDPIRQASDNSDILGTKKITGANNDKSLLYWALTQSDEIVIDKAISLLRDREKTEPKKVQEFLLDVIDPRSTYRGYSQVDTRTSSDFTRLHNTLSQLDTYQNMRAATEEHVSSICANTPEP